MKENERLNKMETLYEEMESLKEEVEQYSLHIILIAPDYNEEYEKIASFRKRNDLLLSRLMNMIIYHSFFEGKIPQEEKEILTNLHDDFLQLHSETSEYLTAIAPYVLSFSGER